MSTIALGSQCFSRAAVRPAEQRVSLRAFACGHARPQGWRAVSSEAANALRLEAATVSYFLSLSDDQLRAENELGHDLGHSTGLVNFDE